MENNSLDKSISRRNFIKRTAQIGGGLLTAGLGASLIDGCAKGDILIDTTNGCSLAGGTFVTQFGTPGTGDGQLNFPLGVALGGKGNVVYICCANNNRVQKFDTSGTLIGWWGRDSGGGNGWKNAGSGLTAGTSGTLNGEFNFPCALEVDSSDYVYVVENSGNRVQKFDANGNYISQFGAGGSGDGLFNFPTDICFDSNNNIYIADGQNHRVQKFDYSFNFLGWWGKDSVKGVGWHNPGTATSPIAGTETGAFNWNNSIIYNNGYIYVSDTSNNRIQKFDTNGNYVKSWGSFGSAAGQFSQVSMMELDTYGNIFVCDTNNSRIQKFDSEGNYISQWGSAGAGISQFNLPWRIGYSQIYCIVFVCDSGNNRIQVFS